MRDDHKSKADLTRELKALRKRVAELEQANCKQGDDGLRKSEAQFREIFENTEVGVYRTTPDGRILMANPALVRMLGYSSFEELAQRNLEEEGYEPKYSRSVFKERIERDGRVVGLESAWIRRDGSTVFVIENSRAIRDEHGNTLYYEGTAENVTERKKAEEELRESAEKYRRLFEGTGTDNNVISIDGVYLMMNEKGAERLGGKPEDFVGKSVYDTFPRDAADVYVKRFRDVAESGETRTYEDLVELPGGNRWFLTDMWPLKDPDGGITSVQLISHDITEHEKMDEALRQSEERYRTLVENLPQRVFLKDCNSTYVSCNENFARDVGISPELLPGKSDYDLFASELAEKYRADDKRVMESGEIRDIEEKAVLQGQQMLIHTVKAPVRDEEGNVVGVLGIFWDITEQKRLELALSESITDIRQAEEELEAYRESMVRAERLASLGTLSATLAHELTQPLTVIALSIEDSLTDLEAVSCPQTVTDGLRDSLSEVSNATSIVERFRNFARKSSEKTVGKVDLKVVAERIVKLLNKSARQAGVRLRLKGMDTLPGVYSSEKEMEQLFFALVQNAIQAADGNEPRELIIDGAVKDEHIELRFSDNCGGIEPEDVDKVFDPFFTTKPAGEGTGLGLCIVQRVALRSGGRVRVENKPGEGSTFVVTLGINKDRIS